MPAHSGNQRITLRELRSRANKGSLSDEEIRHYFKLDRDNSEPFEPAIKLNEAAVDTEGKVLTQEETAKLIESASPASKPIARPTAAAAEARAQTLRVLAEGDSWFNLPDPFFPPTAIDVLSQSREVRNIALWGAELHDMVTTKQYRQPFGSGRFKRFLFSGGGNDVLGSIGAHLRSHIAGDTNPAHAPSYVKPSFASKLQDVMADYETLHGDVKALAPAGTVLFVHGYANAIPRANGPYLGGPMQDKNFDLSQVGPLARAVIAHMVGLFNDALRAFASSKANVVYVDLRPAMNAADWGSDEIHPKLSGSNKIARRFADSLDQNEPVA